MLAWQLAVRYIRGKRSANVVPILSRISMVAIGVGACAMIILFSAFNGIETLVKELYKAFYPEIKISAAKGKFFSFSNDQISTIHQTEGVHFISRVIEDHVFARRDDDEQFATVKGIDNNYFKVNDLRPFITAGRDSLSEGATPTAIMGEHLANVLGQNINNTFSRVTLYYLNDLSGNTLFDVASATRALTLKPDGIFRVQDEFDSKYVLAPLPLVQDLFQQQDKYSSVEISLTRGSDAIQVKKHLQKALGQAYKVETRYEQNQTLYSVMVFEKWTIYALLLFILLIASSNMIGALTLLVLAKRKDMAILKAMGAQQNTIRSVFLLEGILWALLGGLSGILLGFLICLWQQQFKWVKMQGSFIVDAYPIAFHFSDFVLVIITIIVVGLLASLYPAYRSTHTGDPTLKSD